MDTVTARDAGLAVALRRPGANAPPVPVAPLAPTVPPRRDDRSGVDAPSR